jgi:hypothetical protein
MAELVLMPVMQRVQVEVTRHGSAPAALRLQQPPAVIDLASVAAATRLLVYTQQTNNDSLAAYTHYLGELLSVPVITSGLPGGNALAAISRDAEQGGVVLLDEPDPSWLERFMHHPYALAPLPASTWLARRLCFPLRHILLVMRMEETDEAAAEWTIYLAQRSGAAVTILPIVPLVPADFRFGRDMTRGLDELLSPTTRSGAHLRRLLGRLAFNNIHGTLRLREGEPGWQLRQEIDPSVSESNYDLVIIGAEYQGWMGELVVPMLRWIERPLLIAR